jgi:hypothetical protein
MEQRGPDAAYQLRATATKWGFSQTNASNCQDSQPASGAWNQDCTLAIGVADTGKYFLSGGAFVHCSVIDAEAGQVACIQHSEGQPKPIHIPLIITRTPQQLGVAGAGQLIRDYGVQREYVNGAGSPRAAGQQYEGSYLQGLQNRLFNEGRARIDAGEVSGSRTLTILGSDRTRTFTVDVK